MDEIALTKYLLQSNEITIIHCDSGSSITSFFNIYKSLLLKSCNDHRVFSHCQLYYIFQYDSDTRTCHGYKRENCIL